jgi:hypothetical protein
LSLDKDFFGSDYEGDEPFFPVAQSDDDEQSIIPGQTNREARRFARWLTDYAVNGMPPRCHEEAVVAEQCRKDLMKAGMMRAFRERAVWQKEEDVAVFIEAMHKCEKFRIDKQRFRADLMSLGEFCARLRED